MRNWLIVAMIVMSVFVLTFTACLGFGNPSNGDNSSNGDNTSNVGDSSDDGNQNNSQTQCKHTSVTAHEAVTPNCTQTGSIAYWECKICDKLFDDEGLTHEVTLAQTVLKVDPTAHALGTLQAAVPGADCKTRGTVAHYECSRCDKWFSDDKGEHVIAEADKYSAYGSHDFSGTWKTDDSRGHYHLCTVCLTAIDDYVPHKYDTYGKNSKVHWGICSCGATTDETEHSFGAWYTQGGKNYADCDDCGYQKEMFEASYVDFYAINDFHGAVDRISRIGGFMQDADSENKVLINSGDMFQGSMESNSNYGELLSECMDYIGFDSFVYGNHEFDWGMDNLRRLATNSSVPFLGANIYNWNASSRTWGGFASDFAKEYVIKELPNGMKVGIIGVIGKDQITSISSQLVQTIGFKDPKEVVPALSQKLRGELGCDIVVVSAHTGQDTFLEDTSWDITQYADAVFCAHTHQLETYVKNGVPFVQGGSNGRYVSFVRLEVSSLGEVTCKTYESHPYSTGWRNIPEIDSKIAEYNAIIAGEANRVVARTDGSLGSYGELPRVVANAIADYTVEYYPDIDLTLAMVNNARSNISSGEITYSDLYSAIPFDNTVYIAKVSGSDIINEAKYNYIWRVSGEAIVSTGYYYIAVLDYLLYHQNTNRNYNYFASAFKSGFTPIPLEKEGYGQGLYNYRLITRDWMLEKGQTIHASDYGVNVHTDTDLLQSKVELGSGSGGSGHAGTLDDPYTVAETLALTRALSSGGYSSEAVYVKGVVVSRPSAGNSGTVRFDIKDKDGAETFTVYYAVLGSGVSAELKIGDTVVVYGYLYNYNGTTPEMATHSNQQPTVVSVGENAYGVQHKGTLDDPYTVADATGLADGITNANNAYEGYLKATVSNVSGKVFSTSDGSVRNVWVSDGSGNTLQLYLISKFYNGTLGNNWNQTAFELQVGDEVVVYGKFIMYNTTVEMTNGYCVSINGTSTANSKGTLDNPYTVAESLAITGALASGGYSSEPVYVKGIVSSLNSPGTSGDLRFYIKDEEGSDTLYIYYAPPDYDVAVGDTVVIYGYLYNYNGNTPEMANHNNQKPTIVSYTPGSSSYSVQDIAGLAYPLDPKSYSWAI